MTCAVCRALEAKGRVTVARQLAEGNPIAWVRFPIARDRRGGVLVAPNVGRHVLVAWEAVRGICLTREAPGSIDATQQPADAEVVRLNVVEEEAGLPQEVVAGEEEAGYLAT